MQSHKTLRLTSVLVILLYTLINPTSIALAEDDEDEGDVITLMNNRATITYYSSLDTEVAEYVKGAIEKAWPKYTELSGMELGKLNLQIGHLMYRDDETRAVSEPYGITSMRNGTCEIIISTIDSSKRMIESTTVHELMHCWQFEMKWPSYKTEVADWMMESTAVWTEDLLYDHDTEFDYLKERFSTFPFDFFSTKGNREYGSYLYFKFLQQNNYITPKLIFTRLKEMKVKTKEEIMGSEPNLQEILKKYTLWNLNFGVFQKYKDDPHFKKVKPHGHSTWVHDINGQNDYKMEFNIDRGGSEYTIVKIDKDVKRISFETNQFNTLSDKDIVLQAIVKIDGVYKYEDWSNLEERVFCRNKASEEVTKIVIFPTHTNLNSEKKEHKGIITVDSDGMCDVAWRGVTTFTKSGGDGLYPINETLIFTEELEEKMNKEGKIDFVITKQNVSVTGSSGIDMGCIIDVCTGRNGHTITYQGSTYSTTTIEDTNPIVRFSHTSDGFEFVGTDTVYNGCEYVTKTRNSFSTCSCPGAGSTPFNSTEITENTCHDGPSTEVTIPITYEINITERIKGSKEYSGGMYTETVTWDYVYE